MSLPTITPTEAKRLLDEGAMLVDVRGPDEHARERIPGARNHPLDRLTTLDERDRIASSTAARASAPQRMQPGLRRRPPVRPTS